MPHQIVYRISLLNRFQTVQISRISAASQIHDYLLVQNQSLLVRFISTQSSIISNPDFTVNYLINSCGLTPESALKASKKFVLKESTTTKPDSVLSLFKSHGFTDAHISKIIATHPPYLLSSPDKTLRPKLEYFKSIGIVGTNLSEVVSKHSDLFMASVEKSIIPTINFLRSFATTDSDVAIILNRLKWPRGVQQRMGPNIAMLLAHGMPKSNISKLMIYNPQTLCVDPNKISEVVLELEVMGFSPTSTVFISGFTVLSGIKKPIWDGKMEVYKSFGWSEDEVLAVFSKQPFIMGASLKKISTALDFFMNNLNWSRDDISKYATVLLLSMEKRIVPRSFVLQILLSKGLIRKNSVGRALKLVENAFLERFVIRYQNEVPELLKLYQSKVST